MSILFINACVRKNSRTLALAKSIIKDMERFDKIAACSDGCREAFLSVLPELSDKCVTVRNCHRFPEVRAMAENDPILYDENYTNILCHGQKHFSKIFSLNF